MTVRELIEKLKDADPEDQVKMVDCDGVSPIDNVVIQPDCVEIW